MPLPVLASQILTVRSHEADASRLESGENTTEMTELLWPSSICVHLPVSASPILTVRYPEADASRLESGEKTTDLTLWLWPSSVCKHGLQSFSTTGLAMIHFGSSCLNQPLAL